MARYWIKAIIPHTAVEYFYNALAIHAESINAFEDNASIPSKDLDDNGFFIASNFHFDVLCQSIDVDACIEQLKIAAALLGFDIAPQIEVVEDNDWLIKCYQNQPVIDIYPFIIHNSNTTAENVGRIKLKIDAATAFGSGEHPTTHGCLKLFIELSKKHKLQNICDMGCGSGILGIAAKKMQPWLKVVAADIEKEAVLRTLWNVKINSCADNFTVMESAGFRNVQTHRIYDLCFANILAKPLMRMAKDMGKNLAIGGYLIASGLLDKQANMVISAYKNYGFRLENSISINGWKSLLLKKIIIAD